MTNIIAKSVILESLPSVVASQKNQYSTYLSAFFRFVYGAFN